MAHLPIDALLELLSSPAAAEGSRVMQAALGRMPDESIARFVASNVAKHTPIDRLAQAFQSLVLDGGERQRLLALARDEVAATPVGGEPGFGEMWDQVAARMLTSYSDEPYVSDDYGRELSSARARAIDVEQTSDDPPERISRWLGTVATTALRSLDVTLLLDLLSIERDDERWRKLLPPVLALLDDLLLVGDFNTASQLVAVLADEASRDGARRADAAAAIERLVAGSMRHILTHVPLIDEAQAERAGALCLQLGEPMIRPLAEALAVEQTSRARERLTTILLGFGTAGRRTIEQLKGSTNAAVRRTAILLMRQFGGNDALPDLTELLDDSEPQVQREAVRAILNIGTDAAYGVLQQALSTGTPRSRDAIMQAIGLVRDGRAAPLFGYILRHLDHRRLGTIYLRAVDALGALGDPAGVPPLEEALQKGEWWAPRRTLALRRAAASALAKIGTPEARAALERAAATGTRSLRATVRPHLVATPQRAPRSHS
jgi:hypothetical protein